MFEFLKYAVVALILALSNIVIIRLFLKREKEQVLAQKCIASRKKSLPLILTAYERLILLLERINPERMIEASTSKGMTAIYLLKSLIENTNKEFEHNLTQQLYVSEEAWEKVVQAKEEMIALYHSASKSISADLPAPELGKAILRTFGLIDGNPLQVAISALKKDASHLLGNTN